MYIFITHYAKPRYQNDGQMGHKRTHTHTHTPTPVCEQYVTVLWNQWVHTEKLQQIGQI